jgi:bifunctional DNase/RNase
MLVNVKVTAVRWCPLHRISVVILKNDERGLWLPMFVRKPDARRINALLSRLGKREAHHPPPEEQVDDVILNGVRGHPFLAAVTARKGTSLQTSLKPYVDAVLLSLRLGAPLRVDEEIMWEMSESTKAESDRQADLVLPEKREPASRRSNEVLQNELERAVENEEYEQAAILRRIIAVLQSAAE